MDMTPKTRRHLRLQDTLFLVLFLAVIGLLAFLSRGVVVQWDFTQNAHHSLARASIETLRQLPGSVTITAYAPAEDPRVGDVHQLIRDFIAPYRRAKPDLVLKLVDPADHPQQARAADVRNPLELVVEYHNRSEHVSALNEQALTNALMRLARDRERLVLYLDGHGERKLDGIANHDLGDFGRQLQARGFRIGSLNLALAQDVPSNAALLLIAGPQVDLMPGEVSRLKKYLEAGGNLLWLIDQEPLHGLRPLAENLGLVLTPGVVIDPAAQQLNAAPTLALSTSYGAHPATATFDLITAFPFARQIGVIDSNGWRSSNLIEVAPRGWVETREVGGSAAFDRNRDVAGPINIGVALERTVEDKDQRVVVIGSGGFLANTYLGNGGNLGLGISLMNWLAGDERLITIPTRPTMDAGLLLSKPSAAVISVGFLIALPLAFLAAGGWIWWRRRRA
jgi:ABC-type uncharacterized transport system involved in gliding motility auxiliary subunit